MESRGSLKEEAKRVRVREGGWRKERVEKDRQRGDV